MDRLDDILLAVSRSEEIDRGIIVTAAQQIVNSVVEGLNGSRASVWLIDDSIDEIICFNSEPEFPADASISHSIKTKNYQSYLKTLEEQHFLLSYDDSDFMQHAICNYDNTIKITSHSSLTCAIRYRGGLIGILRCEANEHREWTYREGNFLTNLADMVGRGLLAQRWQSAEDSLHSANMHLEKKVIQRTKELSQTLDELHLVKDQLVESEKMAALGGLVAGVAHEINTPLGICITSISHLKTKAAQLETVFKSGDITEENLTAFLSAAKETLHLSQHHLQRTANLVKSFKQVAVDQSVDEISKFNLHNKLEELITSFRHELKSVSAIMLLECPDDIIMTTYSGVLDQIITNLAMNSIHHGLENVPNGMISIEVKVSGDNMLRLVFSDNGWGVPEENRNKIFNPFFTTRRNLGGTGLGLNILYNLVYHKLQGTVKLAENNIDENQGATFVITLPICVQVKPQQTTHTAVG